MVERQQMSSVQNLSFHLILVKNNIPPLDKIPNKYTYWVV